MAKPARFQRSIIPPPAVPAGPAPRWDLRIILGLGSIWSGFAAYHYYRQFPAPWRDAGRILSTVFSSSAALDAPLLGMHLLRMGLGAAVFLAAWTAGEAGLRLFSARWESGFERAVFAAGLGCGTLAFAMFFCAALGVLYPSLGWILLVSLDLAGLILLFRRGASEPSSGPGFSSWLASLPFLDKAAAVLLAVQVLHNLAGALSPPIFYDSLAYHLAVPSLNIVNHRLVEMPHNFFAHMPMLVSYFYAFGMLVGDEVVAKFLSFGLGILCAAATGLLGLRWKDGRAGLWGAAIFYTMYHVGYVSVSCAMDLGLTLFSVLSVHAFAVWGENRSPGAAPADGGRSWLLLSGIFGGMAAGCKYTSAFLLVGMAAALLFALRRKEASWREAVRAFLVMGALWALLVSPWLVKNVVYKGNPVYPFLHGLFSPGGGDPGFLSSFFSEADPGIHSLKTWLLVPWEVTLGRKPHAAVFTPVFICLLPVLALFRGYPPLLRRAFPVLAASYLLWSVSNNTVRFLMPVFPIAALALGVWLVRARIPAILGGAARALVLAAALFNMMELLRTVFFLEGWRAVTGAESAEDYLSRSHMTYPPPSYPALRFANERLPQDARILFLGEFRSLYLKRDCIAASPYEPNPFFAWAEAATEPAALRRKLAEKGVTHLLLNIAEFQRTKGYGTLKFGPRGAASADAFWARYAREVFHQDEVREGRPVNRVLLYELMSEEDAALPHEAPYNYLKELAG